MKAKTNWPTNYFINSGSCECGNSAHTQKKHNKFTQSKFDIFLLHRPFSGFYKGNRGQNKEIQTDLKNVTQTWFAGLRVYPGLILRG